MDLNACILFQQLICRAVFLVKIKELTIFVLFSFLRRKKIKIKIIRETKLVYVCLYIYDICNNRTSIQSKLVTEMQKKIERCIIDKKNASIWLVILLQLTRNFSRTFFNSPITAIEVLDLLFLWLSERCMYIHFKFMASMKKLITYKQISCCSKSRRFYWISSICLFVCFFFV